MEYTGSNQIEGKEVDPDKSNPEANNEKAAIDTKEPAGSGLLTHENINLGDIYHEPFDENARYD